MRRARIPGVVAAFPTEGPPALRGTAATPRITLRTQARGIRRVRELGDQSVRSIAQPSSRGGGAAAGGAGGGLAAGDAPVVELFRLKAVDGERNVGAPIPPGLGARTLLVYNPLSAPMYIKFGVGDASAANHDVACPGSAVMQWPIDATVGRIAAVMDYPGAVPVGDVADAVVRATSAQLPAFIGPLT
jgi:hypothetical protein